jgi:hypothetical protein
VQHKQREPRNREHLQNRGGHAKARGVEYAEQHTAEGQDQECGEGSG